MRYGIDAVSYMLWALIDQLADEDPNYVRDQLDEATQRWYAEYLEYRASRN